MTASQEHPIRLRRACMEDAPLLLAWRNDPETRKASITGHEILVEEHMAWLRTLLKDNNRELFMVLIGKRPIGTVRRERHETGFELSWTVCPDFRGKGLGKKMVRTLAQSTRGTVTARIKKDNARSVGIAEHAGMTLQREENGILIYERKGLDNGP